MVVDQRLPGEQFRDKIQQAELSSLQIHSNRIHEMTYLVQIGLFGEIMRFRSVGPAIYQRDAEVVCRTTRGLEIGRIVSKADLPFSNRPGSEDLPADPAEPAHDFQGTVLRTVTRDDRMIMDRIKKFKDRAFAACQELLVKRNVKATLLDVEHLFDGTSLYFYFWGETPNEVHALTTELSEIYDAKVKFRQFADRLANGCGPGCGTTASKCSTSGCSSCAVLEL